LHTVHNEFIQSYLDIITIKTEITKFITGEDGCGLALSAIVVAIVFWTQRKKL